MHFPLIFAREKIPVYLEKKVGEYSCVHPLEKVLRTAICHGPAKMDLFRKAEGTGGKKKSRFEEAVCEERLKKKGGRDKKACMAFTAPCELIF